MEQQLEISKHSHRWIVYTAIIATVAALPAIVQICAVLWKLWAVD